MCFCKILKKKTKPKNSKNKSHALRTCLVSDLILYGIIGLDQRPVYHKPEQPKLCTRSTSYTAFVLLVCLEFFVHGIAFK